MITFFQNLQEAFYGFISTLEFSRTILVLKLASYGLSLFLSFLIVVLLTKSQAGETLRDAFYARRSIYGKKTVNAKWAKIQNRLRRGDEVNLKLAIIEADNIFGDILKQMGLPGADFEARLRQFEPHELKSVNLVWEAHNLRNAVINDPAALIAPERAKEAIEQYETALKELEYFD